MPPHPLRPDGKPRRVGVEIEFAAEEPREIAGAVQQLYGGNVVKEDPHRFRVEASRLGTFKVELDTQLAHPDNKSLSGKPPLKVWIDHEVEQYVFSLIGDISRVVVPYEVVTPPLPLDRLPDLDELVEALRRVGAEGTDENLFYAFGVHFNPEAPALTAESILAHLRAFLVLADWLVEELDTDLTRRVLPYIRSFPKDYALKVLDPGYQPDLARLIDDYLEDNPTRNRGLDLLPLFMHLDAPRVLAATGEEKRSSPRPAFHYRLPDCRLNDPEWSLAREWNYWVEVERLAADSGRLDTLAREFITHHSKLISWNWSEKVSRWMKQEPAGP